MRRRNASPAPARTRVPGQRAPFVDSKSIITQIGTCSEAGLSQSCVFAEALPVAVCHLRITVCRFICHREYLRVSVSKKTALCPQRRQCCRGTRMLLACHHMFTPNVLHKRGPQNSHRLRGSTVRGSHCLSITAPPQFRCHCPAFAMCLDVSLGFCTGKARFGQAPI